MGSAVVHSRESWSVVPCAGKCNPQQAWDVCISSARTSQSGRGKDQQRSAAHPPCRGCGCCRCRRRLALRLLELSLQVRHLPLRVRQLVLQLVQLLLRLVLEALGTGRRRGQIAVSGNLASAAKCGPGPWRPELCTLAGTRHTSAEGDLVVVDVVVCDHQSTDPPPHGASRYRTNRPHAHAPHHPHLVVLLEPLVLGLERRHGRHGLLVAERVQTVLELLLKLRGRTGGARGRVE